MTSAMLSLHTVRPGKEYILMTELFGCYWGKRKLIWKERLAAEKKYLEEFEKEFELEIREVVQRNQGWRKSEWYPFSENVAYCFRTIKSFLELKENVDPTFRALEAFFKGHKFNKYCETRRLIWLMFVLHSMVNDIVKHFLIAGTCVNIISFWYFRNKLNNVKFTMTAWMPDKIRLVDVSQQNFILKKIVTYTWIYERSHMICAERYEFMIDHRSYTHNLRSCEIKAWKNAGLNGIRTHDLCDIPTELSSYLGTSHLFIKTHICYCCCCSYT